MTENPLEKLGTLGQSLWLDYIRRDLMGSGDLQHLIDKDGLRGMTSNPSIFEEAIAGSHDYDKDIRSMALAGKDVPAIYAALSQQDVQSAADEFRSVYDETEGRDGYVSLEVNPHLAHDTSGTWTKPGSYGRRSTGLTSSLRSPRLLRVCRSSSSSSAKASTSM